MFSLICTKMCMVDWQSAQYTSQVWFLISSGQTNESLRLRVNFAHYTRSENVFLEWLLLIFILVVHC